jgi:hypothetical protein
MPDRLPRVEYAVNPIAPLHKRWRDHLGTLRVITGPAEGWVMVRYTGSARPFCLRLSELLNADAHPNHGPFEPIGANVRNLQAETVDGASVGINAVMPEEGADA